MNIHTAQRMEQSAVLWLPCNTKVSPCYYVQLCRADDFYARGSRLNISVVCLTGKSFQALQPYPSLPVPIVAADFLYFVGKNNMLVYFSVLIRQWSSLHPLCPLLRDKGTSKASVFVFGAPQEDKALDLLSGSGYRSGRSKSIIYAKNSLRNFALLFLNWADFFL